MLIVVCAAQLPCWHVPGSGRCTLWCLGASLQSPSPNALLMPSEPPPLTSATYQCHADLFDCMQTTIARPRCREALLVIKHDSLGRSWSGELQHLGICRSKVVITASGGARAKKAVPLKQIADKAVQLAAGSGFQVRPQHSLSAQPVIATPS